MHATANRIRWGIGVGWATVWLLASSPFVSAQVPTAPAPPVDAAPAAPPPDLGSNVVARIAGFDVPYDWFLHEFRSTFFRCRDHTNVRAAVFAPFLERMTLYELARQAGIPDRPEVRRRIEEKIGGLRAFLEYQVAMAEVELVTDAYVESRGIAPADTVVADEEIQAFFDAHVRGQPGAPENVDDLPAEVAARLRRAVAMEKYGRLLSAKIAAWRTNLSMAVNQPLVDAVPLPEMEGAPPEFRNLVAP